MIISLLDIEYLCYEVNSELIYDVVSEKDVVQSSLDACNLQVGSWTKNLWLKEGEHWYNKEKYEKGSSLRVKSRSLESTQENN